MKKTILILITLLLHVQGKSQSLVEPLAYWAFNDSTANDSSPFQNNGVIHNVEFSAGIDCSPGAAFNGDDSYINFGNILDDLFKSNVFSISLWVYAESYKVDAEGTSMIMSKWHSSGGPTDNSFILYTTAFVTHNKVIKYPLSLFKWQHIVVSNDTGRISIYVNNIKVAEGEGSVSNETDYPLYLGARSTGGTQNFLGNIDEVKIFRQALSKEQVNQIYSASRYSKVIMHDQTAFTGQDITIGVEDEFHSYYWNNGAITPNITVTSLYPITKQYSLSVSDVSGCIMSDNFLINWFDPADSLAVHWNFDDASANDVSVNQVNGTIKAVVPFDSGVMCSRAMSFDGDSSNISFGDKLSDVFTNGDFTISLWAFIEDTIDIDSIPAILIQKWHTSGQTDNSFILYTNSFRSNNTSAYFKTPPMFEWNHYVVVNKNKHVKVFINNVLVSESFNNQFNVTDYPLMIGALYNNKYNFKGKIDDVRIYNGAFSTNEISGLYKSGYVQPLNRLSDLRIYEGETVTLDAGSGYDRYTWSSGGMTQIINLLNVTENIPIISVVAKNIDGCYSDTISISVDDILYNEEACGSFTSLNGKVWTESGTYTDTVTGTFGGDVYLFYIVKINIPNTNVASSGGTLIAEATGASYQWLDCNDNFGIINGETSKSFKPSESGNYAVRITENGCVDTSDCYEIIIASTDQFTYYNKPIIYSSFNDGTYTIDLGSLNQSAKLMITDISGRHIAEYSSYQTQTIDISFSYPPGIYIVSIIHDGKQDVLKIIRY
ncbi:MAG: T9SS type A sorting domain-containing protein [Bacteroidales bacterium]|nr:T9SS type A sorting domain-containing protein [Bacteroidales bacterium]